MRRTRWIYARYNSCWTNRAPCLQRMNVVLDGFFRQVKDVVTVMERGLGLEMTGGGDGSIL